MKENVILGMMISIIGIFGICFLITHDITEGNTLPPTPDYIEID